MNEKTVSPDKVEGNIEKNDGFSLPLNSLLKMASHGNGYKREEATRQLGVLGNSTAISTLILRFNDWVPQVRIAALQSIKMLATSQNAYAFVLNLPSLYHLKKCGRSNHMELIDYIERYLVSDNNNLHIANGLKNSDGLVARACIHLIIEYKLQDTAFIVKVGLDHADIVVRVRASQLMRELNANDQKAALDLAIKDKFMPIRKESLQILIENGVSDEFIKESLFDRHSSIREISVRYLLDRDVDVAGIYIGALKENSKVSRLKIAIWGIGWLKTIAGSSLISGFLTSSHAGVRKQSLMTMMILKGLEFEGRLPDFISDPSQAVCKEAARQCLKSEVIFTADRLVDICNSSLYQHSVASCLGLSKKINKWERLLFLLRLIKLESKSNVFSEDNFKSEYWLWWVGFNNSFSQPKGKQVEVILGAYCACRSKLSLELQRKLVTDFKVIGVVI